MRGIRCGSEAVTERPERTAQGYKRYRCRSRGMQFNERSGTVLNCAQYPSDVVALVVLWRLRYKRSLRDLAEMFLVRGMVFSHEAVSEWEAKLTPVLAEDLRRRRRGRIGRSWHVDETYIRVDGRWCYVYRAIGGTGALVDVLFSERRDMAAAMAFFRSAKAVTGIVPDRVTTDGHDSYPRAIRTELGKHVCHRTSRYRNNGLQQGHRGLKGRYRPLLAFLPHRGRNLGQLRPCGVSTAPDRPPGSVEATTSSETSSALDPATTDTSPPPAADCSSCAGP